MVLLYPFATCVFCAQEDQNGGFELRNFVLAQRFTRQTTCQDAIQFRFVRFREQHHVQRVVGHFTAVSGEVIQTLGQRGLQVSKTADVGVRHFTQFCHVIVEGGQLDVESFIRAPAWQHFHVKRTVFGDGCVVLQRIDWVIGGADHFHIHLLHDAARGEFILRQQLVALIPDFASGRR